MSLPFTGMGTCIGAGAESTWGTPVSASVWFPAVQWGLQRKLKRSRRSILCESTSRNPRSSYVESDRSNGPITLEVTYEGFGMLLRHLFGASATTGPVSGDYTHTYTLARALPVGLTLTGVLGDSSYGEVFSGCKLAKGTLTIEAGKCATLAADVIAKTSGGRVAAATPSHTGSRDMPVVFDEAGTLTWNGGALGAKKVEISIDNKLAERAQLGDRNTKEPTPSDFMDIMIKVDLEYVANTLWTGLLAGTDGAFQAIFTDPDGRTITIDASTAQLEEVSDPITSTGIIGQTATFRCKAASDEGLIITVVNTSSGAVDP